MAFEIGEKVIAEHKDGDIFIGTLTSVLIGVDSENPTKASITIEDKSTDTQVMLWCDGLKDIKRDLEV
jgi:hypothetical protein